MRFNQKVLEAKTVAEKNSPLDPIFIENAITPILTYSERNATAKSWAELENRHLSPTPNATDNELRDSLQGVRQTRAMTNFSLSENSKETSTNRMQDGNSNAAMFFEIVITQHVTNQMCSEQIKVKDWSGAWRKLRKEMTSKEKLIHAATIFEKEINAIVLGDPTIYVSENFDHFLNRISEAEANLQEALQYMETSPPTRAPAVLGGPPAPIPFEQWRLTREQIKETVHNSTDSEIRILYPDAIWYRRGAIRMQTIINGACGKAGSKNDKVKELWLVDVNRNPPLESHTSKSFIARMKNHINHRENSDENNKTVLLVKSKVVAVNNIKTDERTPAQKKGQGVKREDKLCKTCKKFRPDSMLRINRNTFLMNSHNTEDCFLEHGAKYNAESKRVRFGGADEKKQKEIKKESKRKIEELKPILKDKKSTDGGRSVKIKKVKSEKTKTSTKGDYESEQSESKESDSETAAESGNEDDGDSSANELA